MVYIGIDNGVTGALAMITNDGVSVKLRKTPVKKEQSYTKAKAQITRVDYGVLYMVLRRWVNLFGLMGNEPVRAFVERPYVNPKGFKATVSALRCLEAMIIALEQLSISYEYVDSKQWQKVMLPSGLKGAELKEVSRVVGIRLFPNLKKEIESQKDADALLIAEWARREGR